jgi:hypothetical protein
MLVAFYSGNIMENEMFPNSDPIFKDGCLLGCSAV